MNNTLRFMQTLWALVHALEVRSKRMARTLGVTGPHSSCTPAPCPASWPASRRAA